MHQLQVGKLYENCVTRSVRGYIVAFLAASQLLRPALNWYYRSLKDERKQKFHERYARIFYDSPRKTDTGTWIVEIFGKKLKLPISSDCTWRDWDLAIAFTAHDLEVKKTYNGLLHSGDRPDLFIDIGANYGTHSMLMSAAGINVISFEPNEECRCYAQYASNLNNLEIKWHGVALGRDTGTTCLVYPERETFLGKTIDRNVLDINPNEHHIVQKVTLRRLDEYINYFEANNLLIKIDVEGSELDVLMGATAVIARFQPKIIFESLFGAGRVELASLFLEKGYQIYSLPWPCGLAALTPQQFESSIGTNFIGVPAEPNTVSWSL